MGKHKDEAWQAATEETQQVKKENLSTQLRERARHAGAVAPCRDGAAGLRKSYPPVTRAPGAVPAGHEGCDARRCWQLYWNAGVTRWQAVALHAHSSPSRTNPRARSAPR